MSLLFSSGGQNIGASESLLPVNIQGRFPLGLTGVISLYTKDLSNVFSSTMWKQIFQHSVTFMVQLSHPYMTAGETIAFIDGPLSAECLCLILCHRFVIAFLPRSKCLLMS